MNTAYWQLLNAMKPALPGQLGCLPLGGENFMLALEPSQLSR